MPEPPAPPRSVVVVTGASSGIGRATVLELARHGATVVAVARRERALASLAEAAATLPGRVEIHAADVSEPAALRAVADEAVRRFGRLDAWVNNAAVNLFGAADVVPADDVHRVVAVNLGGYINGTRAALPHFRERGRGVVVNVSSILGHVPAPYQSAYVATKHAIHGWSAAVRQEVRGDGIAVCEIAPGPVDTPLFEAAGNHMGREVVPLRPISSPERIARAIVRSIAHPRDLRVPGGQNAALLRLGRVAPRLAERLSAWQTRRNHFGLAPVPSTSGNLHEPDGRMGATIRGGWSEVRHPRRQLALVGALLAAAALAARTRQ